MIIINTDEIVKRLTTDVKDNQELLQAIANFVYPKKVENVEFVEWISSHDSSDNQSVMLILLINDEKIGIQFNFNNIDS